jgi:hypothetical protein
MHNHMQTRNPRRDSQTHATRTHEFAMEPRSGDMELALVRLQTLQRLSAPNGPHIPTLRSLWPVTVRWCEALVPASNRWILTIPSHGSRLPQLNLAGCPVTGYNPDSLQIHGFHSTLVRLPGEKAWFTAALKDCSVTRREGLVHGCTEGLFGHQARRPGSRLHSRIVRSPGEKAWFTAAFKDCSVTRREGLVHGCIQGLFGRVFEPWVQPWNLGDFHSRWGCQGLEKRAGFAFGQHCWDWRCNE